MKNYLCKILGGVLFLTLPLTQTSCEWLFGDEDNPVHNTTPEEILTNLGAALEDGALITINFTIDGVDYTSTFKKVGDEYVEQSTVAGARAMTRAAYSFIATLAAIPQTQVLDFEVRQDGELKLNTQIQTDNGEYTTTIASPGAAFGSLTLNSKKTYTTTVYKLETSILLSTNDMVVSSIKYKNDETWKQVYERLTKSGKMILQVDNANKQVLYTVNGRSGVLYYDKDHTQPVRPADAIGKNDAESYYLHVETIEYKEFTLNEAGTGFDDVIPDVTTSEYNFLTTSKVDVDLQAGTYVVRTNVTIDGLIGMEGDVKLILCDGVTLKLNGGIYGSDHNLTICGQDENTGKLNIVGNDSYGLYRFTKLTIHGGDIQIKTQDIHDGVYYMNLYMLGGKLSSTSAEEPICTGRDGTTPREMKVYGGEIMAVATNSNFSGIKIGNFQNLGTLTVYGGTVTAISPAQAIEGSFAAGGNSGISFFGRNSTDEDWQSIVGSTTNYKYFHAEAPISPTE